DADAEHEDAGDVRQRTPLEALRLFQSTCAQRETHEADGDVDEEGPWPAEGPHEVRAEARTDGARERADGTPKAHGNRPLFPGKRGEDQRERGGHQKRRADGLEHTKPDQGERARRKATQCGRDGEERDAAEEQLLATIEVSEPPRGDEERAE